MAKFNSISDFANKISKGTFGIVLFTSTIPTMRKTNNPYFGRVVKLSYRTNVALGWGYETTINGRLENNGLEGNFIAEKPKGKTWIDYPFILASDKDNSVKYLRTYTRKNTITKSMFALDGVIVTDDNIIAEIMSFIPSKSTSKKQGAYGLEEEDKVNLCDYTTDNILYIAQGSDYYAKSEDFGELLTVVRGK